VVFFFCCIEGRKGPASGLARLRGRMIDCEKNTKKFNHLLKEKEGNKLQERRSEFLGRELLLKVSVKKKAATVSIDRSRLKNELKESLRTRKKSST